MAIVSINPYSEEINGEFEPLSVEACEAAVGRAREATTPWAGLSVGQRAAPLKKLAALLREQRARFGACITQEMGKPIRQAIGEIDKCAWLCDYYGANAERLLTDERITTEAARSFITFEPLGVILGIMPWNFPFWQVFRFAVPAMVAGNACLLKHASNVPLTALEIERLFREAGFPENIFQTLVTGADVAQQLIAADLVDGVSLTGSVEAGAQIGALTGKGIKKLVLELGGSDPFIVLEDADIEKTAEGAVEGRLLNTGQSCIAAKRFIVMNSIAERFHEAFLRRLRTLKAGDPMREDTTLGPLARRSFVSALEEQLEDARTKGAELAFGPEVPQDRGFFFRPVIATRVTAQMRIVNEEVFGPIAPILPVADIAEALQVANATSFGLGASVWTRNLDRAESLVRGLRSGFVAVNSTVKSDPRLPFGGIKKSGVGRELSHYGLKEFTNIKTVVMNKLG